MSGKRINPDLIIKPAPRHPRGNIRKFHKYIDGLTTGDTIIAGVLSKRFSMTNGKSVGRHMFYRNDVVKIEDGVWRKL